MVFVHFDKIIKESWGEKKRSKKEEETDLETTGSWAGLLGGASARPLPAAAVRGSSVLGPVRGL